MSHCDLWGKKGIHFQYAFFPPHIFPNILAFHILKIGHLTKAIGLKSWCCISLDQSSQVVPHECGCMMKWGKMQMIHIVKQTQFFKNWLFSVNWLKSSEQLRLCHFLICVNCVTKYVLGQPQCFKGPAEGICCHWKEEGRTCWLSLWRPKKIVFGRCIQHNENLQRELPQGLTGGLHLWLFRNRLRTFF